MLALLDAWFIAPFDYGFMRRAVVGGLALSLAAPPLGVFLVLRGMSLIGDAMAHAILPGVALGFLLAGFSLPVMSVGGVLFGLMVALLAGAVSKMGGQREDAAMASFFIISLAAGVMLISMGGSSVDLTHVLFGSILAINSTALLLIASISTLIGGWVHSVFLGLLVLNLTAGFQTLGTLMAVGLMMLPATAARFWSKRLEGLIGIAVVLAMLASTGGLLLSFHLDTPSGPSIILLAGVAYLLSALFGRYHSLAAKLRRKTTPLALEQSH